MNSRKKTTQLWPLVGIPARLFFFTLSQVMKTYHMYHTESLSAESKLKEAEKQEEKHIGKVNDISTSLLRYGHDERPQRRSSVKKMEKLKEKVCYG